MPYKTYKEQIKVTQFLEDGTEGTKINNPLTDEGYLPASIFDSGGNRIDIDGLGNMKVAENSLIVGESFEGDVLDTNFWTPTVDGSTTGSVTQDGELILNTNGINGEASAFSVRKARKIPGTVGQFRSVGHFESPAQANNVRTLGISDSLAGTNGAWFKLDGITFKVVTAKGGVETEVSSGSFNGDVSEYTIDINVHRFVIEYTSYVVKFYIDGVLIHKVFSTAEFWTSSLTFGIRLTNINSNDNATNNELHFQLLCIVRLGKLRSAKAKAYQSTTTAGRVLKYGAGAIIGIILGGVQNTCVVSLYDAVTATGTPFFSTGAMSQKVEPTFLDMYGIDFFDGLTLEVENAAANVTVIYE